MVNLTVGTKELTEQLHSLHSCDKKKTTSSDAREKDSAANRNTNATALRIIIDSLSNVVFMNNLCAVVIKHMNRARNSGVIPKIFNENCLVMIMYRE